VVSRRRVLAWGLGGLGAAVVAGTGGAELILHGVLPGKSSLERLTGGCDVATPTLAEAAVGPSTSGTFDSAARQRSVGYSIAYPPGHGPGSQLPLVLALHGYGGNHTNALSDLSLGQALALSVGGTPLPPMALVAADGGGGYWHAHPAPGADDPMGMLVDELIPMCQKLGLGQPPQRIGAIGISMGGYGALLLAEQHPGLLSAVAAISPAVWTTYGEARGANAGAFASAADFAAHDIIARASSLGATAVRIASGKDDPFHPGVEVLARALPAGATVVSTKGCHTNGFELSQEPDSLAFLAAHLA